MTEYKLKKYAHKILTNKPSFDYINKFIYYKKILYGGELDPATNALVEDFQRKINDKCKKIDNLQYLPIDQINYISLNNDNLINLLNQLTLKNDKITTYALFCKILHTLITPFIPTDNIKLITEKDIKSDILDTELLFTLFIPNPEKIKGIIISILNKVFKEQKSNNDKQIGIKEKIMNDKNRTATEQMIAKFKKNTEDLQRLIETLTTTHIDNIVFNFMIRLSDEILIKYNEIQTEHIYKILEQCIPICNASKLTETGAIINAAGAKAEKGIYEKLKGDNSEYSQILYQNVFINENERPKGIKDEFDLVVGKFDNSNPENKTYNIKNIYDIKTSAKLIIDDVDKFNRGVEYLISEPTKKLRIGTDIYNADDAKINPINKGYIYVRPLSMGDSSFILFMNIISFIYKNKTNIDNLFYIFTLIQIQFQIQSDGKVLEKVLIDMQNILSSDTELKRYIMIEYEIKNTQLTKFFQKPVFTVYECALE